MKNILFLLILCASISGEQITNMQQGADSNTVFLLHFNEGSGAVSYDSSGSGNNGTYVGTTIADGVFDKARDFNGTTDYASYPSDTIPETNTLSVFMWLNIVDDASTQFFLDSFDDGSSYDGVRLYAYADGGLRVAISDDALSTTYNLYDGWYYVGLTYDGNIITAWGNGAVIDTKVIGDEPTQGGLPLIIGRSAYGTSRMNGSIDDVKIDNRILSAAEIMNNYTRQSEAHQ